MTPFDLEGLTLYGSLNAGGRGLALYIELEPTGTTADVAPGYLASYLVA